MPSALKIPSTAAFVAFWRTCTVLQQPVLLLKASVLQQPVLPLDLFTRQPMLPLNMAVLQQSAAPVSVCSLAACATPLRVCSTDACAVYVLPPGHICFTAVCVLPSDVSFFYNACATPGQVCSATDCSGHKVDCLWCPCTCLLNSRLCYPWTCLFYTSLCCHCTYPLCISLCCLQKSVLPLDVSVHQQPVLSLAVSGLHLFRFVFKQVCLFVSAVSFNVWNIETNQKICFLVSWNKPKPIPPTYVAWRNRFLEFL